MIDITKIECPHCGAKDFTLGADWSTCDYYPPRYVNGVNINPDNNQHTTTCKCNSCGKVFYVKWNHYEQSIHKEDNE